MTALPHACREDAHMLLGAASLPLGDGEEDTHVRHCARHARTCDDRAMVVTDAAPLVIDCRWLGYSGIGIVTEALLEGLHALAPGSGWVLWGPPPVEAFLWPGARH